MAKRLFLRDGENLSADQVQRLIGSQVFPTAAVAGVGTGYAAGIIGKLTNVATTGHLAVTANGATMVLTILAGWAEIIRDAGGSTFDPRAFFAESDANDTVTIGANASGTSRTDTVCLKVDLNSSPSSDGSNLLSFVALQGGASNALANAPADGNLYLPLANVVVANGAASLAQGNVTDKRTSVVAFGSPITILPLGGNTQTPHGGTLGYAQVTANQTGIVAATDLTSLTVTVVVGAGRRIRLTGQCRILQNTSAAVPLFSIQEGASVLGTWTATVPAASTDMCFVQVVVVPSAGSHTYKLTLQTGAGTIDMNASATQPAFILCEDIGV